MISNRFSSLALRLLVLFSVVLIQASIAAAQRSGSAASGGRAPERVTTGTATQVVGPARATPGECSTPRGTYSFGYAFSANASPRHGGAETERAGLAFAVNLTCRIFVEIDNDNVLSIKTTPGGRVTGFGDTTIYAGVEAVREKEGRPGITLVYGIKIPTASSTKGIGSGEVDHTLLAAIGKSFNKDRAYFEIDAGDYIAGRANASGSDHFPFASGFLKHSLGNKGRYTLHIEVGGDFATSQSNASMYSLNYVETRLSGDTAKTYVGLRAGAKFGLTPNASRAGLYLGLKLKGNLKNVFK